MPKTPLKRAIAQIRASDPVGWAPATDEQIAKMATTQLITVSIAMHDALDAMAAPLRRLRERITRP